MDCHDMGPEGMHILQFISPVKMFLLKVNGDLQIMLQPGKLGCTGL